MATDEFETRTLHPIAYPLVRCPGCESDRLDAVVEQGAQAVHFLCRDCDRCWNIELGYVRRVAPGLCLGCPERGLVRTRVRGRQRLTSAQTVRPLCELGRGAHPSTGLRRPSTSTDAPAGDDRRFDANETIGFAVPSPRLEWKCGSQCQPRRVGDLPRDAPNENAPAAGFLVGPVGVGFKGDHRILRRGVELGPRNGAEDHSTMIDHEIDRKHGWQRIDRDAHPPDRDGREERQTLVGRELLDARVLLFPRLARHRTIFATASLLWQCRKSRRARYLRPLRK